MKSKSLFLTAIVFILFSQLLTAQITFQKRYGWTEIDEGKSVLQTFDGGYIIVGNITRSSGYADIYLIKTDNYGDTLWTKTFGRIGDNTEGFSVDQLSDSGFIITGFAHAAGNFDLALIRTDNNGDTLWTKLYIGFRNETGYSVHQTFDGGFIIAGKTNSYGAGEEDFYLVKTDANGDSVWTRTFGGISFDEGQCMIQTTDSGYIVAGSTYSFGVGANDIYLVKTDASGDTLWTKAIGDSANNYVSSIKQTFDGGFIITGISLGTVSNSYLMKTDSMGNISWSKTFNRIQPVSVVQTSDSNFVLVGNANKYILIVKTNSIGDTLWTKAIGDSSYGAIAQFMSQTSDGGFVITGKKNIFDSLYYDVYLLKTDSNGFGSCDENFYPITISSSQFQVTFPPTIVGSGGLVFPYGWDLNIIHGLTYVTPLCTSVDIIEVNPENKFILFPNPTEGNFTIKLNAEIKNARAEIYNMLGEMVYSTTLNEQQTINNKFPSGIYFVKVTDSEKQFIEKLIEQ